jgi:hypothetical protein
MTGNEDNGESRTKHRRKRKNNRRLLKDSISLEGRCSIQLSYGRSTTYGDGVSAGKVRGKGLAPIRATAASTRPCVAALV